MGYLSTCRADSTISSKKPSDNNNNNINISDDDSDASKIRHYTYSELESATSHFSSSSLLGRGSHGSVYRAVLPTSGAVAVKRPSRRHNHHQSNAEIENEITILSSVRSPRLVNLLGFTPRSSGPHRLLVVELMPNGTLFDLLHSRPRPPSWPRRLRLALHTATALRTLHSLSPPVVHRDVKSANVLLDARSAARLADFGLALRLGTDFSPSSNSTPPAGTLGYLDPSYINPEDVSTKTDVFSFGILLFEIISGRKAIDVAHSPPSVLEWAVPLLKKGKVLAVYDPRIPPPRDSAARRQLAGLAASCVRSADERRPGMDEVVEKLRALSKAVVTRAWNPCSAVETEGTLLKVVPESKRRGPCSAVETERTLLKIIPEGTSNGKVSRNLMELMARPERENAGEAVISRVPRNRSLKVRLESRKVLEGVQIADGRVRVQARDIL